MTRLSICCWEAGEKFDYVLTFVGGEHLGSKIKVSIQETYMTRYQAIVDIESIDLMEQVERICAEINGLKG